MNSQSAQLVRQTLLLSLVLVIIAMIVFPAKVGTGLAKFSLAAMLVEWAIYAMVLRVMTLRISMPQIMGVAVICLAYRLSLGALLGVSISIGYRLGLFNAMELGMVGYLPAVLLYVAATPFVLRPIIEHSVARHSTVARADSEIASPQTSDEQVIAAVHTIRGTTPAEEKPSTPGTDQPMVATSDHVAESGTDNEKLSGVNGFERATRYIGEDASVHLAAVVDSQGLIVSQFVRGEISSEEWAPLTQLLLQENEQVLKRVNRGAPEQIDLALPDRRVVVVKDGAFYLLVLADRQTDELLRIKINQALDGIRKHVAARYGRGAEVVNREHTHAASTQ